MAKKIKKTERGFPGHFIGALHCVYRRNTLIEAGSRKIVISSVGNYRPYSEGEVKTIGINRYYETIAFEAIKEGDYWEANVSEQISFNSEWAICADSPEELPKDVDNQADQMHEQVVRELSNKLKEGDI